MVGHTGVEDAAIKAIETVDACVGRTVEAIKEPAVSCLSVPITAMPSMVDYETGEPWNAHTNEPGTVYPLSMQILLIN